ncbi:uncharacterized protein FOMMEDRAFT_82189, partial [Fomitiporia mediterranea MF3/22]|uniref:uncharacterized protein n=1 Tax=Fomitiporia mediterranea (strain MF3/22) TaxID=694068 RepID=UPI0004407F22
VVLAASICTKAGKPVISRQFREMTRARIESLLASFPKLIPAGSQHTSIETPEVRYVYQPLEELYILLITNKASNILQDIDTLHLFARVVSDMCRSAEEREILRNAFELLGAFDEIVSLGYREQINLMQVRNVLEMESHEEKIQEIIARNKEAEAKEELKRRAKQLEMQRREQQRRAAAGGGVGGGSGFGGGMGSGGMGGYSPVPRYEAPSPQPARTSSPAQISLRAPAFKGSGMKLGSKKKTAELLDALGGEAIIPQEELSAPATPAIPAPDPSSVISARGSLPAVTPEGVHVVIKEHVSLQLLREGGLKSMEVKGDMNLQVSDPAQSKVKLALAPISSDFNTGAGGDLQFKQHPNVAKFAPTGDKVVALKDPSRAFPVGQSLAVLKWRYAGKDESLVPLSINCWPTPSNDGTCEVNIEYELENDKLALHDVVISIPLPTGSYPTVSQHTGTWSLNASTHSLDWSIPLISSSDEEESRTGTLEFAVGGDDASTFFPVRVAFLAQGSLVGMGVENVSLVESGESIEFSQDVSIEADEYVVV